MKKRLEFVVEEKKIGKDVIKDMNKDMDQFLSNVKKTGSEKKKEIELTNQDTKSKKNNTRSSKNQLMGQLGVMFAGMALQRSMQGLTATAKEWTGIGEIMSDTMGVVMLPATLNLLEKGILPLSEGLMGLSENTQMTIGVSTLSFEAVGGVAMFLGQAGLAGGALESIFPKQVKKGAGGLAMIKGMVGITIGVTSLKLISDGINEGDVVKELIGVIGLSLGGALVAGAVGVAASGAIVIGTIAAAALVSVMLTTNWVSKKTNKRAALLAAGLSKEQVDAEMGSDVTFSSMSVLPSLVAKTTGLDVERVAPAFNMGIGGSTTDMIGSLLSRGGTNSMQTPDYQGQSQQISNVFHIEVPTHELADYITTQVDKSVTEQSRL